jgi:predicted DsbA family dithiol-disulfide isomerase
MTEPRSVAIEVVSDVICPWCFIGKRRLEKALALLEPELAARVTWLPFQLNPAMPREGVERAEYRRAKFGSLERSQALDARVAAEGRGEGIDFAFDRMRRTPNTFAAHQLIDLAQEEGVGGAVVEALFRAYFEQGRDTGDAAVLKETAAACGLDAGKLEARWADESEARRVAELEEEMKNLGISGVPTYIIERRYAVSGAQPPQMIAAAIREAAAHDLE